MESCMELMKGMSYGQIRAVARFLAIHKVIGETERITGRMCADLRSSCDALREMSKILDAMALGAIITHKDELCARFLGD